MSLISIWISYLVHHHHECKPSSWLPHRYQNFTSYHKFCTDSGTLLLPNWETTTMFKSLNAMSIVLFLLCVKFYCPLSLSLSVTTCILFSFIALLRVKVILDCILLRLRIRLNICRIKHHLLHCQISDVFIIIAYTILVCLILTFQFKKTSVCIGENSTY